MTLIGRPFNNLYLTQDLNSSYKVIKVKYFDKQEYIKISIILKIKLKVGV